MANPHNSFFLLILFLYVGPFPLSTVSPVIASPSLFFLLQTDPCAVELRKEQASWKSLLTRRQPARSRLCTEKAAAELSRDSGAPPDVEWPFVPLRI